MESCRIASDFLSASFLAAGAELQRLTALPGQDLLWDGDPKVWGRHSPVLFPIVGALKDNLLVHEGVAYPMPRHGFARDLPFTLVRLSRQACVFQLTDSEATRAAYPFPFLLRISYQIQGSTLQARYAVQNPARTPLPFSLGTHPAFRWPLAPDLPREAHTLEFQKEEPGPVRRLSAEGLLLADPVPSPLKGRNLPLNDALFEADALVFEHPQSRAVRYSAPGGPQLEMVWEGFSQLGIWSKPDAGFLCLEPWQGHASPEDWEGEFSTKPGVQLLPGGATASFGWNLKFHSA
jgi:galactose mutarotase-like enzyme